MLLKNLILLKIKNGDDIRDHIRKFFDIVDKINEMVLEIIDDLLILLYSIPDEYESIRIALETLENCKIKLLEEYETRNRNIESTKIVGNGIVKIKTETGPISR